MTLTRRWWWLGLAVVVALAVAGSVIWVTRSHSHPQADLQAGPLAVTRGEDDCHSLIGERTFTVRLGDLNDSYETRDAVVTGVTLGDAKGIAVDDAELVPAHDVDNVLTGGTLLLPQSSRRLPVPLSPTGQDGGWAVVVHLRATEDGDGDVGFSAARVEYTIGGDHYRRSFDQRLSASEWGLCYGTRPSAPYPAN